MDLRFGQQVGATWQGTTGVGTLDTNPHVLRHQPLTGWDFGKPSVIGTALGAHSTTTLQDTTKAWVTNQWAGYKLAITNAPVGNGTATAGNGTTLTDGGQAWTVNGFTNWSLHLLTGAGAGQQLPVASNTGTVITVQGTFSPAPAAGTTYQLLPMQTFSGSATAGAAGTLTDASQAWTVNQFAKMAVRITNGTGLGQILPITSNTATVLTVTAGYTFSPAPDATSKYTIIDMTATIVSNTKDTLTVNSSIFYAPINGWSYSIVPASGPAPMMASYMVSLTAGAGATQTVQIRSNDFGGNIRVLWTITPPASAWSAHPMSDAALIGVPNGNVEYICSVSPTGIAANAHGFWLNIGTPKNI
jgi:hypothetical protein